MRTFFHPKREDISLPSVLYALSDPLRLKMVAELASLDEAICASDFSANKGIAKSTQSHHFKVLRETGITHTLPQGTRLFVSLRREDLQARFPGLLDAILHLTILRWQQKSSRPLLAYAANLKRAPMPPILPPQDVLNRSARV